MRDERFERDDAKDAINRVKHKLPFHLACHVFEDLAGLDDADPFDGEPRSRRIGLAQNRQDTA